MDEASVVTDVNGKPVEIALVAMEGEMYRYMNLTTNKCFLSETENREEAYLSQQDNMAIAKNDKEIDLKYMKKNHYKQMLRIMKYVIISYINTVFEPDDDVVDEDIMTDFITSTSLYDKIVSIFFHIGLVMNVQVNDPKKVFRECVKEYPNFIVQTALGTLKIVGNEKKLYDTICTYIRASKKNK